MVPMPKTPLPYAAGYGMPSDPGAEPVPDTIDDARLAAMGIGADAASPEISISETAARASQPTEPLAPPRRAITPAAQRTLLHGSLSDALEAVRARAAQSQPQSEVRTVSVTTVQCPIVPLAIVR
jgi:hypothetical protein